jgi:hypothetical protein
VIVVVDAKEEGTGRSSMGMNMGEILKELKQEVEEIKMDIQRIEITLENLQHGAVGDVSEEPIALRLGMLTYVYSMYFS